MVEILLDRYGACRTAIETGNHYSGKYLASGGFDKTVRVRDLSNASQKEIAVFTRHSLNVSDVQWSFDSAEILSGCVWSTISHLINS